MSNVCYYCKETQIEMRPYGPGGATVCFTCTDDGGERKQMAMHAIGALIQVSVVLGAVDTNDLLPPFGGRKEEDDD